MKRIGNGAALFSGFEGGTASMFSAGSTVAFVYRGHRKSLKEIALFIDKGVN